MSPNKALVYAGLFLTILSGCTSIKTSFPTRATDGKFYPFCMRWPTKGVPCKFQVPTGIKVSIEETYFIETTSGRVVVPEKRILDIKTEEVFEDQLFLVHVPRPAAGTLNIGGKSEPGYTLSKEGYLTAISAKVDDTTIEDINASLGPEKLGRLFKQQSSAVGGGTGLKDQTRLIAIQQFSYVDPNWVDAMNEWIRFQTEACSNTCPSFSEPSVSALGEQTAHSILQGS
jgi:hypothetical protein